MWNRKEKRIKQLEFQIICWKGMIRVKEDEITRAEAIINELLDEKKGGERLCKS